MARLVLSRTGATEKLRVSATKHASCVLSHMTALLSPPPRLVGMQRPRRGPSSWRPGFARISRPILRRPDKVARRLGPKPIRSPRFSSLDCVLLRLPPLQRQQPDLFLRHRLQS